MANVSQYLQVLRHAQMVEVRREGLYALPEQIRARGDRLLTHGGTGGIVGVSGSAGSAC